MVKVRIVPFKCHPKYYIIKYKKFLFWRSFKRFSYVLVFPKNEAIEKAKALYYILNFKFPEAEQTH